MGDKNIINFLVMDIILATVFIGMLLLVFEFHRFFLAGELIILAALILIDAIALIAVFNGIRWGYAILSLSFAVLLIDLLVIYFLTRAIETTFFITMVISAIGFIVSVINIKEEKAEVMEEPMEKGKEAAAEFKPGKYIASKTASYYHAPKCDWAKKIKKNNQIWLSEEQVKEKGLKKHDCLE